ncbi:prostate-associated microseminoprotein isoform X2 [Anguilla rostrata]
MRGAQKDRLVLMATVCLLGTVLPCLSIYTGGECYFNAKAKCEHQDRVFGMGESWLTAECDQCVCLEPFGVGCCELGSQPVDYPDWCEVVRKPDSCNIAVVMRANHKLPCLYGGRGRMRPGAGPVWKADNDPMF